MKRSLTFKITSFAVAMMVLAMAAGVTTNYIVHSGLANSYGAARISLSAERSSRALNDSFLAVENVVNEACLLAEEHLKNKTDLLDDAKLESALSITQKVYTITAEKTKYVCGYWLFCNPDYTDTTALDEVGDGFFYVKARGSNSFEPFPVTNVLKYEETDMEHIGWWIQAKDERQPLWMTPYFNANSMQNLITYVVPFFSQNNDLLGVVGIDLQFDDILQAIENAEEFNSEHCFLLDKNENILYHPDVETYVVEDNIRKFVGTSAKRSDFVQNGTKDADGVYSYNYRGKDMVSALLSLRNRFIYGIAVERSELYSSIILVTVIPVIVYSLVTIILSIILVVSLNHFLRPLKELNEAVSKVKEGDLNVDFSKAPSDELGELTSGFSSMLKALRAERAAMNALAFQDGLTGVKNKNAHEEKVAEINRQIKEGKARFAVVMCDVNNLKTINDTEGHSIGDEAIRDACLTFCHVYAHSPVYRVGGDEFCAILEDEDYEHRESLISNFTGGVGSGADVKHRFSVGMATFQPGIDKDFNSVFVRADDQMYRAKKRNKKD